MLPGRNWGSVEDGPSWVWVPGEASAGASAPPITPYQPVLSCRNDTKEDVFVHQVRARLAL